MDSTATIAREDREERESTTQLLRARERFLRAAAELDAARDDLLRVHVDTTKLWSPRH